MTTLMMKINCADSAPIHSFNSFHFKNNKCDFYQCVGGRVGYNNNNY